VSCGVKAVESSNRSRLLGPRITSLALFLIRDSNLVEIYLRNNGKKIETQEQQRGNAALGSPGKASLPEPPG
jgi:hypothetical protein